MAVEWFEVCLRGYGGAKPTGVRFFEVIGLEPGSGFEARPSESAWQSALLVLFSLSIEDCEPGTERYEEFAARLAEGLKRAAKWLAARDEKVLVEWRAGGKKCDVFIGGWINSDQFELTLPPEFLLACGRLGLPIEICTND